MFPDLCSPSPLPSLLITTLIYRCRISPTLSAFSFPFFSPLSLHLSLSSSPISQSNSPSRPACLQPGRCPTFTLSYCFVFFPPLTLVFLCAMLSVPLGPLRARIWNILERHIFAVLEHKGICHGRGCLKWLHRGNQNQSEGFEKP